MRTVKITALLMCIIMVCMSLGILPVMAEEYTDVPYEHWAHSYISICQSEGLMRGTSQTTFAPDSTISVAEAITVAVRLTGKVPEYKLSQSTGGNWYDTAVDYAKAMGIIYENQFESYTRPALRAELAYLLAVARPESEYEAINNITALPDVDYATIYTEQIFKLYNAGILTGSDYRGTFYPYNNITRAEAATIICRLSMPNWREKIQFCSVPYDLTVTTTNSRVNIGGLYSYGVVNIGGKPYISPATLEIYYEKSEVGFTYYDDDDYGVRIYKNYGVDASTVYDSFYVPAAGMVLGTAKISNQPLEYDDRYYYGAVCTLGDAYSLFSLEALGAVQEVNDFIIPLELELSGNVTVEVDYAGYALPGLQRDTVRNTALAIHDYIVNTLTYDPVIAPPPGMNQAAIDEAWAITQAAEEKYAFESNVTLGSKYGICQDYAELYYRMCNRAGVPCFTVVGGAMGLDGFGSHAWNKVYADGEWKFVDTTHDDPISSKPVLEHTYFMIDANKLANTHVWGGHDYPLPDEYDPAWEQIDPMNVKSADEFRKCLVAQLMMGNHNIRIRGVYGGLACIYAYEIYFESFYGGYNSSANAYDFTVRYFGEY